MTDLQMATVLSLSARAPRRIPGDDIVRKRWARLLSASLALYVQCRVRKMEAPTRMTQEEDASISNWYKLFLLLPRIFLGPEAGEMYPQYYASCQKPPRRPFRDYPCILSPLSNG